MGAAVFTLWGSNVIIAMSFPILLNSLGLPGAFSIYGLIGIIGSIFVLKYVPETKDRSLEQIEHFLREKYSTPVVMDNKKTSTPSGSLHKQRIE